MRKIGISLFIASMVTVVFSMCVSTFNKVSIAAPDTALTEQGWQANFSVPLKKESLDTDDLYVTDHNGTRMTVQLALNEARDSLRVKELGPGSYTLHIKKNALEKKLFKSFKLNEIEFTVHETLQSVASEKELKAYFKQAQKMQKRNESFSLGEEKATMDSSAEDSAGSSDHSETNNQVEGVDEADRVQTNGDYIYSVLGDRSITITDIRNPEQMTVASAINMNEEFYPTQLFLHGDTLIVLGDKYVEEDAIGKLGGQMNGMTAVRMYDVSDATKPLLIREVGAEGYLNGARKTGEMLYFVTNIHHYFGIGAEIEDGVLRPRAYDSAKGEESAELAYKDISILPGAMEPSYSVITAIDLSSPAESTVVTKGYLGGSEQLYMSANNLYLTASIYHATSQTGSRSDTMMWNPGNSNTELFKFTLKGTDVTFHSAAALKGNVLNQFSMDEHEGYFRVVTTEGNMWDDKNPSKNHLFILDEKLAITGSVEGLAKGERIYSARFMGDKAYMVTFRETDPLFVIDVADPVSPKVLGELKIPGFSNYLHPLDDNHLIGFGYETVAKKNEQGGEPMIWTLGMKVSLFDVSDFTNPKEKDTEIIGGRGTSSQLQYDHKALFQHKERKLFGFPVTIYNETRNQDNIEYQGSGALVYEITPEKGIVLKGDLLQEKREGQQYEVWETEIQRMLYSKGALYTVSAQEIKSYSLDTFKASGNLILE